MRGKGTCSALLLLPDCKGVYGGGGDDDSVYNDNNNVIVIVMTPYDNVIIIKFYNWFCKRSYGNVIVITLSF